MDALAEGLAGLLGTGVAEEDEGLFEGVAHLAGAGLAGVGEAVGGFVVEGPFEAGGEGGCITLGELAFVVPFVLETPSGRRRWKLGCGRSGQGQEA